MIWSFLLMSIWYRNGNKIESQHTHTHTVQQIQIKDSISSSFFEFFSSECLEINNNLCKENFIGVLQLSTSHHIYPIFYCFKELFSCFVTHCSIRRADGNAWELFYDYITFGKGHIHKHTYSHTFRCTLQRNSIKIDWKISVM